MATRILLIDDHAIVREGLRLRLEQEPDLVVVGEAGNSLQGYELMTRSPADLVIMDLNLPGENGVEATIKFRERWPNARVIVLTGESSATSAKDAIFAGASGFLRKEDAGTELIRAVQAVTAGKSFLSPDAATAITAALLAKTSAKAEPELSDREVAVLKGLAQGQSYKEIASDLKLSPKSIETYRARIVKKTGCSTRADLVLLAVRRRIVQA